ASRDDEVHESGVALCKGLYAAAKLGGLWGYDGKVAKEAIDGLVATLRTRGSTVGDTALRVANEQVFLDGRRVRTDFAGFLALRYLAEMYATRQIGEIRFGAGTTEHDVVALL